MPCLNGRESVLGQQAGSQKATQNRKFFIPHIYCNAPWLSKAVQAGTGVRVGADADGAAFLVAKHKQEMLFAVVCPCFLAFPDE